MGQIFYKYQSLGNDFILFDWLGLSKNEVDEIVSNATWPELVQALCARHYGVGADGVIVIISSDQAAAECQMYNPNGTRGEKCLNGLRCAAQFLVSEKSYPKTFSIHMFNDVIPCEVENNHVQIKLNHFHYDDVCEIEIAGKLLKGHRADIGNPHFVILEEINLDWLKQHGRLIETHDAFPNDTNVEFIWHDKDASQKKKMPIYKMLVYERGCGLTLACGSGAAAAMTVLRELGNISLNQKVKISMLGGDLISYFEKDDLLVQTCDAKCVFQGKL